LEKGFVFLRRLSGRGKKKKNEKKNSTLVRF